METNTTTAEQRGAEAERARILALIDEEIKEWEKDQSEHPYLYQYGINKPVIALGMLRELITKTE